MFLNLIDGIDVAAYQLPLDFNPFMNRLECTAAVETPEEPSAHVSEPQFLMFWSSPTEATVVVYFMENLASRITDPHAVSIGPDVSLRYSVQSPSGAVAAGISLRKLVYRFRDLTQRKYEFTLKSVKSKI